MITDSMLRSIALQAGLSKYEMQDIYKNAVNEANSLGKGSDDNFVLSIINSFAGLDEESINNTIKKLNIKFIESGYTDFDKFLEDAWVSTGSIGNTSAGVQSTDFPQDVRPEHKLGHAVKMPPVDIEDEEDKKEVMLDLNIIE